MQNFSSFLKRSIKYIKEPDKESLYRMIKHVPETTIKILLLTGHSLPSIAYMKYRFKTRTKIRACLFYPVRWKRQAHLLFDPLTKKTQKSGFE
jgi:hypothetical protein